MLVSEETGALQAIVYIYACQVKMTRSVPDVRGRFHPGYVVYTIYGSCELD